MLRGGRTRAGRHRPPGGRDRVRAGLAAAVVAVVAGAASVAWANFTATVANPASTLTAAADVTGPTASAGTAMSTGTGAVPGHITQGAAYRAYTSVADTGSPASGVASATADLSAITSGQSAATTTAGSYTVGGVTYGRATGTLTAGATLPMCRYTYAVTGTDAAGNTAATDQQVMVDRVVDANTYRVRIDGQAAGQGIGWENIADAGDVNGDGVADVMIGSEDADNNGRTDSGSVWIVFGPFTPGTVDLAALGTRGYRIDGAAATDEAGYKLAAAGDVNGDGRADQLVVADETDYNGRTDAGSVYVVFGKATTTTIDLGALGTGGYRVDGAVAGDKVGKLALANVGDVNGDGRPDLLVGAYPSDYNGRTDSGSSWVVFGKTTTTTIDLAALGTGGYRIDGAVAGDELGVTAAALPDVNGDGRPETVVSAGLADRNGRTNSGSVWVVFGKATTTTVDLNALGTGGYRIDGAAAGDQLAWKLAAAGDVSGDGTADLLIGADAADRNGRTDSGTAYVVFGKATTTTIDLAALGTGGYEIRGAAAGDALGSTLGALGDVNGDGRPDTAVGAAGTVGTSAGSVYVVFGRAGGGTVDLASYGTAGYRYDGAAAGDNLGMGLEGVTDADGDGVRDVLVAASGADNNGRTDSGSVYLVPTPTCSYRRAVLSTPGLQSYWRLDETSGTAAADSKGAVTGTYTYTYTLGAAGGTGDGNKAVTIDHTGYAGRVTMGDAYDFPGTAAFSAEAWVKITAPALDGGYVRVIAKDGPVGGLDEGWDVEVTPTGGASGGTPNSGRVNFARWRAGAQQVVVGTTRLLPGRWYHVVATSDATTMSVYVNGRLDGTGGLGGISLVDTTRPLYLAPGGLVGTVDDAAVYDVALTAAQVAQHYAAR